MSQPPDTTLRASDVGLYVFCARAWRLRADGYESQNLAELAAGTQSHRAHGARIFAYDLARRLSLALLALALVALALWLWAH